MRVQMPSDKELTDDKIGASDPLNRAKRIARVLTERFAPTVLAIEDDSARHHGHAGAAPGGETHFNVVIESTAFVDQTRVGRQRLVMDALKDEFATGLHALSIKARAPGEA